MFSNQEKLRGNKMMRRWESGTTDQPSSAFRLITYLREIDDNLKVSFFCVAHGSLLFNCYLLF